MSDFIQLNDNNYRFINDESWVVLSVIEQKIKSKIEAKGIPLKDWNINIYRGVLTGFNEAFIIDDNKKNELISQDPRSAEIIRPILRGRDIKKYNLKFADQWLINSHNGIKEKGIEAIDVALNYPAVFNHLSNYESDLIVRLDKGKHWSNLRNCAYLDELEKEKIIWIELTDHPNFALDVEGYFINNTIFFMTGDHLKYLLAFLNSRVCEWYFDKIAATSGVGTRRWIKMYIDQICIPKPNIEKEIIITQMIDSLNNKFDNNLYEKLNNLIYQIFEFSSDEIDLITNADL